MNGEECSSRSAWVLDPNVRDIVALVFKNAYSFFIPVWAMEVLQYMKLPLCRAVYVS